MKHLVKPILMSLALLPIACDESSFSGQSLTRNQETGDQSTGDDGLPGTEVGNGDDTDYTGSGSGNDGSADYDDGSVDDRRTGLEEDGKGGVTESFSFDGARKSSVVDYLFIMDNSCSMKETMERTAKGFLQLVSTQPELFAADSRVAVMTTMAAKDKNFKAIGDHVKTYTGIESEPGFLDFVDKTAIDAFKASAASSEKKAAYSLTGCTDAWFAPDAKTAAGGFCLNAAMQNPHTCVGREAGVTAFVQLLRKNKGNALFRDRANLNIIFISDTQEPGKPAATAIAMGYKEVRDLALTDNTLQDLKFHALAPGKDKECTSENVYDKPYTALAKASGGREQSPCKVTDLAPFMKDMVEESQKSDSQEFTLSKRAGTILSVRVDGVPTKDYRVVGNRIIVGGLGDKVKAEIIVSYLLPK